jgi:hypothetical protein
MFAFIGACVVTMGVYSVIWRRKYMLSIFHISYFIFLIIQSRDTISLLSLR